MKIESKDTLTPDHALEILKEGNERFVNNLRINRNLLQQVNETSEGQYPFATILNCIDSRTSSELIFDQGLGDIFSIRIAGNVLNEDILGSIEFATRLMGSKLLLVLGHTGCGAIKNACDHAEFGNLTNLLRKIVPAIDAETTTKENRTGENATFVDNVAALNVTHVIERIKKESEIVTDLIKEDKLKIVGAMYNIENGEVTFFND